MTQSRPKRRIHTWQIAGIVLLLGVAGLLGYAFWPEAAAESESRAPTEVAEQAAEIDAVVLEPVDFPLRVEATGHLQSWRRAEISPEATGLVVRRLVNEGQYVQEGDLLLQLDARDVEIELQDAEADWLKLYADYQIYWGENETSLGADSTVLSTTREAWKALHDALPADSTTEQNDPNLNEVKSAIQSASLGLTQAEQRLQRAKLAMSRTRVIAPFSGRVADVQVEEGQHIAPGEHVMTLLDDGRMKVEVDVLEANIVRLKKGATARVRIPSVGDESVSGTIHSINPSIDPESGAGRVTIAIPNRRRALMAGLFSYTYLESDRLPDRLVLPADAVLARQGRDLVFRIEDGNAQWVYVEVGRRSGNHVEITDGLAAGDTIAVAGHFALAHDTPVVVREVLPAFDE